ncbi:hypothetical protein BTA51_27380 [Hahella sp. CCB-MM4]|uniref:hypothetical protein n=1 Tax=Hahella sp. (strain CCB-MM4) TaxID=1926491 RepID=UPI000B9C1CB8|nr:hypothetical protein [Hahella sp. CCB-MM4]OZG70195.1 hypothetical protein BTA51_27380 [Hahella sp. CCB-MM4]
MTSLVTHLTSVPRETTGLLNRLKEKAKGFLDMPQNAINLFVPIEEDKEPALREVLEALQEDTHHNAILPLAHFSDSLHFARFLIYEGPEHPKVYGSYLVFIANVDGPVDSFLQQLVHKSSAGLDAIFSACRNYPPKSKRTRNARMKYLQQHLLPAQAFYVNTIGRGVKQIQDEERLRQGLQEYLNTLSHPVELSATELRLQIINHVAKSPDLFWALEPPVRPSLLWKAKENLRFITLAGLGVVVVTFTWPLILGWVVVVQIKEMGDEELTDRASLERLNQLRADEDFAVHNQFSAAGSLKPGLIRRLTARSVLSLAQFSLRHVFNNGDLAGIPLLGLDGVDTIHFAHWIMLDNDQRLLFASNYDGSLESYMVDFIDKVSWGLNVVFSNGQGYPRTNWLFFDGARNEQRFKDYLGHHQLSTLVWHAPYKHLSAVNIANNAKIRAGLRGRMNEKQAKAWLQRLS